jgi:hypothetical protein
VTDIDPPEHPERIDFEALHRLDAEAIERRAAGTMTPSRWHQMWAEGMKACAGQENLLATLERCAPVGVSPSHRAAS